MTRARHMRSRATAPLPPRKGQVPRARRPKDRASRMRERDERTTEALRDWTLVILMILGCLGLEFFIAYLLQIGVL